MGLLSRFVENSESGSIIKVGVQSPHVSHASVDSNSTKGRVRVFEWVNKVWTKLRIGLPASERKVAFAEQMTEGACVISIFDKILCLRTLPQSPCGDSVSLRLGQCEQSYRHLSFILKSEQAKFKSHDLKAYHARGLKAVQGFYSIPSRRYATSRRLANRFWVSFTLY